MQVVFGGEVVGESAIEFEERIGAEVVHTFEASVLFVDPECFKIFVCFSQSYYSNSTHDVILVCN